MKKFFIALSVLAALMLSVVPSQALIGVADVDALGNDAIIPFITEMDVAGRTGLNTLMIFTDVLGGCTSAAKDYHYTVYTVRSKTVFDDDLECTPHDVFSTDGYTIISGMASTGPSGRDLLEVDLDGDGTNDHYAGYVWFDLKRVAATVDNAIGAQLMFVNLAKGIAASVNIPMKEFHADLTGAGAALYNAALLANDNTELFSPNALQAAKDLQDQLAAPADAATFGLYPRYYIAASGDESWLLFWQSANRGTVAAPQTFHVDWYDDEENDVSSNIEIGDEFTIVDLDPIIPDALFTTYKKEGWINLTWNIVDDGNLEMLGWTFNQAFGTIGSQNTSWGILNPMWRNVTK